ncbi:very-short-patch-repair endonuclease [Elusimicrobium posterum]|uniref:endonuclease domain-containing protein n=1 Tax=Elusimicrobium posterum TaxID=3116653 RepID=UPI003C773B58
MLEYDKNNTPLAKKLRKQMTPAEVILWNRLRRKNFKEAVFLRQKTIGPYIVDFCCIQSKLIIELDGGGHFAQQKILEDRERDFYLNSKGFTEY